MCTSDRWKAAPRDARWYGEVIGSLPDEDIDYVYGFSADDEEPDISDLVPEGWVVEESTIKATPGNPAWVPSTDDD